MIVQSEKQQFWYQQHKQATVTLVPHCHLALFKLVNDNGKVHPRRGHKGPEVE
jgi:hypothetical protein